MPLRRPLVLLLLVFLTASLDAQSLVDLARQSNYIVRGTVERLNAEGKLALVRVERIYDGATTVGDFTNGHVLLDLSRQSPEGDRAVFLAVVTGYGKLASLR